MFLGQNQDYRFYSAEIDQCPPPMLQRIVAACKAIELSVWNPASEFESYFKRQSAVLYAKHQDQIVGFALFELYVDGDTLVVAGSECMVMPTHQGSGLPTIFSAILISHIQLDNRLRKVRRHYNSMTFVSVTVSYKLMEAFRRYSLLADKSSFLPDQQILGVARHYLQKENYVPLAQHSPYFLKAAFPHAVKQGPAIAKPAYVPDDFQPMRGDAFLFVCRITKFWFLGLAAKMVLFRYRFRFSKRIIPISRISRPHIIYTRGQVHDIR